MPMFGRPMSRDERLGDLAGRQQTAVGLQADVDAVLRRFVGERTDALQEGRPLILETAARGVGMATGRGRDLGDPELAGDVERLAELRHALVADEIGVAGETDRRQSVLSQQVLHPLNLGVVGIAADVLRPAGNAGQLDRPESGAGDAVQRLFEAVRVIRSSSTRRDDRPCAFPPFVQRSRRLPVHEPGAILAGVIRIEPDRARFERHVLDEIMPSSQTKATRTNGGITNLERGDRDLLAGDPGLEFVDHLGDVRECS